MVEEVELKEEVVLGWQGSVFLWFLLPSGTVVAGPNPTEPFQHSHTGEPSSSNPGPSTLRHFSHFFKRHNIDSVVLAWSQDEWTEQKLR